ncbi:hypothetical protein D0C36_22705 [Mucilaginibacter conchicola]|uniref:Uncharacterized protein n=2 Tax=Mucilaginibacter conchicola TaxID=2303333 RepID=A0A372NN62_9SPHI|nr:hypothetical protein D0C36_22705 [Mucilaginibacter conchicola]
MLATLADRFFNRMTIGWKKTVFILAGMTFSFLLLRGFVAGSPIPAHPSVQLEMIHIGQASGLPGGEQPIIQPDTINTK